MECHLSFKAAFSPTRPSPWVRVQNKRRNRYPLQHSIATYNRFSLINMKQTSFLLFIPAHTPSFARFSHYLTASNSRPNFLWFYQILDLLPCLVQMYSIDWKLTLVRLNKIHSFPFPVSNLPTRVHF